MLHRFTRPVDVLLFALIQHLPAAEGHRRKQSRTVTAGPSMMAWAGETHLMSSESH